MSILKKLIPKSLKRSIKDYIITTVGKDKLNHIDILMSMVYDLSPPIIIINETVRDAIAGFQKKHSISDKLNLNVSKSDFMFKYLLLFCNGNMVKTFIDYLESGLNSFNVINKFAKDKFGDLKNANSILDFASGHGRLERFLVLKYPSSQIWVSDIKESSNQFQVEQFGVNSISSTFDPDEYNPPQKFDIIFVGSLFSHLPEELFEKWLKKLYDLISDTGFLIISTHDVSLYNGKEKSDFIYLDMSEDSSMVNLQESIIDTSKYGTTFLNEDKFQKILKKVGISTDMYTRYGKALWWVQDIYVLTKDKFVFSKSIKFDSFP